MNVFWRFVIVLFSCGLFLPGLAMAECFCLVDVDDNDFFGCSTQRQGFRRVLRCLDQDGKEEEVSRNFGKTETTVTFAPGSADKSVWTVIPEGEQGCNPCRGVLTKDGLIRGVGEDEEEEAVDE